MGKGIDQIATRDDCNTIYQTFSSDLTKCVTYKEVNESGSLTTGETSIVTTASTLLANGTSGTGGSPGNITSITSGTSTISTATVAKEMTLSIPYMSIPVDVTLNSPLPLASASSGKVRVFIYLFLNGVQIASGQGSTSASFSAGYKGTKDVSVTATISSQNYYVPTNSQNLTVKMTVTTSVCYITSASATISAQTFKAINKTNKLVKYSKIRSKSYIYGVCTSFSGNTTYNLQQAFGYSNTGSRLMRMDCSISPSSSFSPVATGSRTNYLNAAGDGPGCQTPKTYDSDTAPKFYWKFTVTFPDFYELNAGVSTVQYRLNYKISAAGTVLKNTYTSRVISVNGSSTSGNSYWTGTGGSFTDSGNFTTNIGNGAVVTFEVWISNVSRTSASGGEGGSSSSSRIGVWE